ncbi:MAG: CPBP family intramembrane metalloprotease [Mollicutes bacterium]|nr:CPBP family intramembrane metalloprotease [Mollicutes bacterium]
MKKTKIIYPFLIVFSFYILNSALNTFLNTTDNKVITLLILCFLVFILTLIYKKQIINDLKRFIKSDYKHFFKFFKYHLIGYTIMIFSSIIITLLVGGIAENEQFARQLVVKKPFYSFFLMCILAPYYEEILIRLNFKDFLKSKWTFILSTGLLFGLLHVIFVNTYQQFLFIIPYFAMGITFSLMYYDSNNIFFPIIMHFINNLFSFIVILSVT